MHLKKSFYRYIPDKLLTRFQLSIKPRKVCEYINRNDNTIKGYGIGIFISHEEISKEVYIPRIIHGINSTKTENTVSAIIDDTYKLDEVDYKEIERRCGMSIFNGRKKIVESIVDSIKKICFVRGKELKEQEVLIISDDTEDTKKTVLELSNEVKFLTILANDKDYIRELERIVLLDTGLSIHSTDNVAKTLTRYDFIINMKDNVEIDINKIRKKTILIDASLYKGLSKLTECKRRDLLVINDYIFKNESNICSVPEGFEFERDVRSYIYEALAIQSNNSFAKLRINDKFYTLNSALSLYIGKNRNMSVFREK